ncbi:MAG: hypothetical protein WKG07_42220 [Hymenobacter sp.]
MAARLLAKLNCHVEIASDGYEAIARATAPRCQLPAYSHGYPNAWPRWHCRYPRHQGPS